MQQVLMMYWSIFGMNNDVISFVYNEVKYIQFKCTDDNELYNWIKNKGGDSDTFELTVVGKPSVSEFNNIKTCQVNIEDLIKINSTQTSSSDDWGDILGSKELDDFDEEDW